MFGYKENTCPILKDVCIESKCKWWTHVMGTDGQGKATDKYDCAIAWMPVLAIEISSKTRQNTATLDKVSNAMTDPGGVMHALTNAVSHIAGGIQIAMKRTKDGENPTLSDR